jgi:hypothetical protein
VTLADLDPPNSYTLILEASGGIAGSAKGSAKVHLSEDAGGTLIRYEVEAQVGGRMAQLGGPIIDATAKQLAGRFFSRLGENVGGAASVETIGATGTAPPITSGEPATLTIASPAPSRLPVAWILATVVAALAGFLTGRGQGVAGSDWAGLAIGLSLIVVAVAAFEYGRRSASTVLKLDSALLRQLIDVAKQ